jgi:outer membrane protein assembly factor BamD
MARLSRLLAVLVLLAGATACASASKRGVPAGTTQPDRFLFDRGTELLKQKKWLTAREFFKQVTETYTQSAYRQDAKLAIGDTYLGEGTSEALVLAINEFQEFLSFYPTHARADYAQYKLGMAHHKQMRSAQRDQTETREAMREFDTFIAKYPSRSLMPDVTARRREVRDRLSESEFEVGAFYFRIHWYPAAIDRLSTLVKTDPEFSNRDSAYFFLGESLLKAKRNAEALPYFERVLSEFDRSEFLQEARKRVDQLKAEAEAKAKS